VTLQPDYVVERAAGGTWFRNYRGEPYVYPEPEETDCSCPYDDVWTARDGSPNQAHGCPNPAM
jgi:lysine 2,3-aminomutase